MKWKEHVEKWKDCKVCERCQKRARVVLARGKVPADILFIGEAPGVSENMLGKPFVGPAGKLLDSIIENSLSVIQGEQPRLCWTNLVGCLPETDDEKKEPNKKEIKACSGRLAEIVAIAKPRAIVRVGRLATKHAEIPEGVLYTDVIHPAWILRSKEPQTGLAIHQTMVRIRTLALDLGYR